MTAGQEEVTSALKQTLERTGTLDNVRSLLRTDIYLCLTNCLKKDESKVPTPLQENILIKEIIADYLSFNGYFNTLSVLAAEVGTPSLLDSHVSSHVASSISGPSMKLGSDFI